MFEKQLWKSDILSEDAGCRIRVWFISFMCTRLFDQITWSSFSYSFFRPRPFDQKLGSTLMYLFHLRTTIQPNIRVLINLIFILVHNHSTKVRSYSYFLIYYFLNCANISFAMFKAVLPLHFVRSIHRGAALTFIFRTLYSWQCCSYISCAMSMFIWSNIPATTRVWSKIIYGVEWTSS